MLDIAQIGFEVVRGLLSSADIKELIASIDSIPEEFRKSERPSGGIRNLLRLCPAVSRVATSPKVLSLIADGFKTNPFPVRSIFFDKTPDANWLVPWHQDLTIAVAEQRDCAGFGPWSVKVGVVHVQPPTDVLERMITIRLHLDDCDESNGALRVISGSHREGKLDSDRITEWKKRPATTCAVSKGDALLMKPLLLHASSSAESPNHRRVIHIEYAADDLPGGLQWFERS